MLSVIYSKDSSSELSRRSLTLERLGGGGDSAPPIKNNFQAVLGHFFYIILEIYINKEPMQKIGSPAFIFWSGGPLELSYFEAV